MNNQSFPAPFRLADRNSLHIVHGAICPAATARGALHQRSKSATKALAHTTRMNPLSTLLRNLVRLWWNVRPCIARRGGWLALFLVLLGLPIASRVEAQGTWTALANTAPGSVGLMLLLSDGTVMCQQGYTAANGYSRTWYRLTPVNGSYVNGTWSTLAPMHDTRLWYASQVLKDGRVFVAGGEYGTGKTTGETYDPLTNTWTSAPASGHTISDACSEMLSDGRVLVSLVEGQQISTLIFDPTTNSWSNGPNAKGSQNEATWLKLPDGSILTVDKATTNAERYIPAQNQWIFDAPVPVALYDSFGNESGGSFLLPNGKAFFLGGTGHTAIYTPSGSTTNGSWVAGPDIPGGGGTPDAPAVMLVNGHILCAVSPAPTSATHFPSPTSFYEYNYLTNSFTQVGAPGGGNTVNSSSYQNLMLNLPNGSALYANFSASGFGARLYVYTPTGSALSAGKPTISSVTPNADGSYHLTGTKLNGISEGASYGDDAQMATNYPIVRLTSGSNVYYCRTYNWSSTGVSTGSTPVTTEFKLPANLAVGSYSLFVVANGISSDPFSFSTAATQPASITSPLTSSPLPGTTVTFSWDAGIGADAYWLYVGTTTGNSDLFNSNAWGTARSQTVTNLPRTGQAIYVRLWSRIGNAQFRDFVYTAAPPLAPDISVQQPAGGTNLTDGTASVSFGNVNLGNTSGAVSFSIVNSGAANLTGLSVSKDGSNSADFAVGALGSTTLAPNASTAFSVTFTPGAQGARTAAIHIASNVSGSKNPFDISLGGSGVINNLTLAQALDNTGLAWSTGGSANWTAQTTNTHDGVDVAESGNINDSQNSYVQTTANGPGTLTFWWKVSSESDFDFLRFFVDGAEVAQAPGISGEVDWQQVVVAIPSGNHTLQWNYSKDESVSLGSNAGWVDQVIFTAGTQPVITSATSSSGAVGQIFSYQITATNSPTSYGATGLPPGVNINAATGLISGTPTTSGNYTVTLRATGAGGTGTATLSVLVNASLTLAQALDTTGLTWTTGGNANWIGLTGTTHDGAGSAQSGTISDSQYTYMQTTMTGPGTLSFWWKVSSESSYDFLHFFLDGAEVPQAPGISGDVDWQQIVVAIPSGSHNLQWMYLKDISISLGSDAAWVDQVVFTRVVPPDFNGDGKTDVVWQHDNGLVGVWLMDGISQIGGGLFNPGQVDAGWKIVGVGDFNSDGKPDVVWQHDSGRVGVWLMNGLTQISGTLFNPGQLADPNWTIVGVADFNRDGNPDLVFRHNNGAICLWFMNGINLISSTFLNPNYADPSWKIVGAGDFNGDGYPDLVFRHTSGAICLWYMNGISLISSTFLTPNYADPSWKIRGVGDLNADGKPDLIWEHDSGVVGVWFMDGVNQLSGSAFNPSQVDPAWKIQNH